MELAFSYSTDSFSNQEKLNFTIELTDGLNKPSGPIPFHKTLGFFVIIFTFGTIIVCALIGLISYLLAKLFGKKIEYGEERTNETKKQIFYQRQDIELSDTRPQQFNNILSSLMNNNK